MLYPDTSLPILPSAPSSDSPPVLQPDNMSSSNLPAQESMPPAVIAHTASPPLASPHVPPPISTQEDVPVRPRPSSIVGQRAVAAAEARGPRPLPSVSEVYTATYSSIPVWEMRVGSVDVMRRCRDNWLNATQLLKVACIDKPQRTKILEREIQTGLHEKVQGGYGKYQGTWVPFERGFEIAHQYCVDPIVGPLLLFDPALDPQPAPAPRRTNASNSGRGRGTPSSTPATSPAASPRSIGGTKRPRRSAASVTTTADEAEASDFDSNVPPASKRVNSGRRSVKTSPSHSQSTRDGTASGLARAAHSNSRKGGRSTPTEVPLSYDHTHYLHPPTFTSKLLEWRDSLIQGLLTREEVPSLILDPPPDMPVDLALDDQGHTTLHWAAALARTDCIKLLLKMFYSDVPRDNDGATPLMWAIRFDDNHAHRSFRELLDLVGNAGVLATDYRDRTVLHHVGLVAGEEGKMPAAEYYLTELILHRGVPQAFLDVQDQEGNTALHLMIHEGHTRLAEILQSAGARLDLANYAGNTSELLAKSQIHSSRAARPSRRPRRRSVLLPEMMDILSPSDDESEEDISIHTAHVPTPLSPTSNSSNSIRTLTSSQQQAYTAYSLGRFQDSHTLLDRILVHESALAHASPGSDAYSDRLAIAWADILQAAKLSLFGAVAALRSGPPVVPAAGIFGTAVDSVPEAANGLSVAPWPLPNPEMAMQTMSSRVLEVVGRELPFAGPQQEHVVPPSQLCASVVDANAKKLHKFRALIAKCCAISIEKVDDAVDGLLVQLEADLETPHPDSILSNGISKHVGVGECEHAIITEVLVPDSIKVDDHGTENTPVIGRS